jgi:hypothetical protein
MRVGSTESGVGGETQKGQQPEAVSNQHSAFSRALLAAFPLLFQKMGPAGKKCAYAIAKIAKSDNLKTRN